MGYKLYVSRAVKGWSKITSVICDMICVEISLGLWPREIPMQTALSEIKLVSVMDMVSYYNISQ